MKPYNARTPIGIAVLHYDESGKPSSAKFEPTAFSMDAKALENILSFPASSSHDVVTNAQTLVSSWFLEMGNIEIADREFNRVETELVKCEKWPSGIPKSCEVAFYFTTTKPEGQ